MAAESNRRGSTLLLVMIALAVLMLAVGGAIAFTGKNREGAAAKALGDHRSACAEVARTYVLSRLQLHGVPVTALPALDERLVDAPAEADRTRVMTGHYDAPTAGLTLTAVEASTFGEAGGGARELSNTIARSTSFGQYYRVVAKCRDRDGREAETELVFRYGL